MDMIAQWVEWIFVRLQDWGYTGIVVALLLEVIPSEIILAYAGYLVSIERLHIVGAIACATAGGTLAQLFLFWIGKYGGRPFLDKYGKYLLIHGRHLDQAESWFRRYGAGIVFTARFIPIVRHAISIPAGVAGMNTALFTLLTALAVLPWSIFFIYIGMQLGTHWQQIDTYAMPVIRPVAIAGVLGFVIFLVFRRRKRPAPHPLSGETIAQTDEVLASFATRGFVLCDRLVQSQVLDDEAIPIDRMIGGSGGIVLLAFDRGTSFEEQSLQMRSDRLAVRRQLEQYTLPKLPVESWLLSDRRGDGVLHGARLCRSSELQSRLAQLHQPHMDIGMHQTLQQVAICLRG